MALAAAPRAQPVLRPPTRSRASQPGGKGLAAPDQPPDVKVTTSPGIITGVQVRLPARQPLHDPVLGHTSAGSPGVVFNAGDMTFASPLDLAGIAAWAAR